MKSRTTGGAAKPVTNALDGQGSGPTDACPHRPPCPGCPGLGRSIQDLDIMGQLLAFARQHGATAEQAPSHGGLHYRHRARLAVRGRASNPKLGLFQTGSHRIVDTPRCLVHHPRINEVAQLVRAGIRATRLPPYADAPHRGLIRYLQVMVHPDDARAQVVVVTNDQTPDAAAPLFAHLERALGANLQGLFWNGQDARGNHILGDRFEHIAGAGAMEVGFSGARAFFPPGAFSQNNPHAYRQLVAQVLRWVAPDQSVLELYAGAGTLGLALLKQARHVTFNELSRDSLAGLAMGLAALEPTERGRTRVLPGVAGDLAEAVRDADVVVVDPPRKGLDAGLAQALGAPDGPEQVVYVSCGPASFMADAQAMVAPGALRLTDLRLFDLFPWTGHVEVAARFDRHRG